MRFITPACSNKDVDLSTLKNISTSLGTWTVVQTPIGSNPATISGNIFNAAKNGDAGQYTLEYTINGGPYPNCATKNRRVVTLNSSDNAKISRPQGPFCLHDSVQTIQLNMGASVGVWSGQGIIDNVLGKFDPLNAMPGTHILSYSTAGICSAQDTISIVVLPKKTANILTADTVVCKNSQPFNIRLSSNSSAGGRWLENLAPVSSSFNPNAHSTGIYKRYYVVQGFNLACSAVDSVLVTVNPNADASISAPNKLDYCTDEESIALSPVETSSAGTWWSVPAGAVNFSGVFNPKNAAIGKTKVYYGIAQSCGDTSFVELTTRSVPVFSLGNDLTLCEGEIAQIGTTVSSDMFIWLPIASNSKSIEVSTTGNNALKLINLPNCSFTDTMHVEFIAKPAIDLGTDTIVCFDDLENHQFELSAKKTNYNYVWSSGETGISIMVSKEGKYSVQATIDGNDCVADDEIYISDYCRYAIFFPNAFTPNGDGLNDKFPTSVYNLKDYHLMIFDRWGELIFESFNNASPWDGTYKGHQVQEDVYVWKCDYKYENESKSIAAESKTGIVTLLR